MARSTTPRPARLPASLDTLGDIRAGVVALKAACPHMARAHAIAGDPPLRRSAAGFEGLARIVVGQQVSIASADAIWARLAAAVAPFGPDGLVAIGEAGLKAAGLSRPKIATLRRLAGTVLAGGLDLDGLAGLPDEAVRERLMDQPGIGPWTADVYLLFCLGRRDAFAPGDLALQVAAERLLELPGRPDGRRLEAIAERWRPWRGVAARQLWAYYRVLRNIRAETPV